MTFGEKLQRLRQQAGMSQDALAERLHVSRQAVSRWERDETMPETDKVVMLADLFGVTTDYLLRKQTAETNRETETGAVHADDKHDWVDKLSRLAKTKGYLVGWVLIVWGAMDLLGLLSTALMVNGFLFNFKVNVLLNSFAETPVAGMVTRFLWLPVLYGILKIIAGILVLKYGKCYAGKVKEEKML